MAKSQEQKIIPANPLSSSTHEESPYNSQNIYSSQLKEDEATINLLRSNIFG